MKESVKLKFAIFGALSAAINALILEWYGAALLISVLGIYLTICHKHARGMEKE